MTTKVVSMNASDKACRRTIEAGFTLTEFLICSVVLLVIASATFALLAEIQNTASYQTETHAVLYNTRIAMQTIERYIRQAGNDPFASHIPGITIVNATEVQIRSDLIGSNFGNPDKGDPDGDINDSGENITIRFNAKSRAIEIIPNGGPSQSIVGYVSDLLFEYYDKDGVPTLVSSEVRKIAVTISGSSPLPNPQTHQAFGVTLRSEIRIMA
jgi:prepilin-type N-terminal cleavage/methylation domain-containing protein